MLHSSKQNKITFRIASIFLPLPLLLELSEFYFDIQSEWISKLTSPTFE